MSGARGWAVVPRGYAIFTGAEGSRSHQPADLGSERRGPVDQGAGKSFTVMWSVSTRLSP
jgi:hypothetical protein